MKGRHVPYGVVKNQHFQSTLFGRGRGHKKRMLYTILIMLTIMDDPLYERFSLVLSADLNRQCI